MTGNGLVVTGAPELERLLEMAPSRGVAIGDRARGALLGLAVGNLLGLPVEGHSRASIARQFPDGVTEIDPAEVHRAMDDDLAQAVDLGEALVDGGNVVEEFAKRLVRWRRENGRGIGITTSAVINLLEEGQAPPGAARTIFEDRNRIAPNGGVMRCAPVALARHSSPALLVRDSAATCVVTHYAPACQWSCILLNALIALLIKGVEPVPDELISAAEADGAPHEVREWAAVAGNDIDQLHFDRGHIGHTLLCLQAGLWALKTGANLEQALVRLVSAGGDTDTNGAVAGAVLGARYGASAIPQRWLGCIPQRGRIEGLADKLVAAAG